MDNKVKVVFDTKFIIGLAIICLGVLFLLQNFGFITNIDFWDFWPVVLIFLGLNLVARPREFRQPLGGIILLAIGLLFLLNNLGIIPYDIGDLWPVFLILVGIFIIKNVLWNSSHKRTARGILDTAVFFILLHKIVRMKGGLYLSTEGRI